MKIFKLTILSLAVLLFAAVIYSCSKQDPTEPDGSATEISQSEADILIENKIRAFKGKMELLSENPSYKSSETMSVDSAVWFLKATLNYTYARAGVDFNHLSSDSAVISLTTSDGEITENALPGIYQQILDSVEVIYNATEGNDKNLLMVNVVPTDGSDNTTDLTIYAAISGTTPTYIYGQFGATDYWYWGKSLGKCGNYQGYYGYDASTILEYRMNHPLIAYPPGTYFIPDTYIGFIYPWEYEDPNSPNIYGTRLFQWEGPEFPQEEPCLSPEEMNYYLYEGVAYIMEDNKPEGKHIIYSDVVYDWEVYMGYVIYIHGVYYTYGNKYISSDPSEDL